MKILNSSLKDMKLDRGKKRHLQLFFFKLWIGKHTHTHTIVLRHFNNTNDNN